MSKNNSHGSEAAVSHAPQHFNRTPPSCLTLLLRTRRIDSPVNNKITLRRSKLIRWAYNVFES